MSIPRKGRFTINCLNEEERIEIVLDMNRELLQDVEEESDAKNCIDRSTSPKNELLRHCIPSEKEVLKLELGIEKSFKRYEIDSYDPSFLTDNCLAIYQELMDSKYIEMINFHKTEILKFIIKDSQRQQQIMNIIDEVTHLTKLNLAIEQENLKIKKLIKDKGKL